MVRKITIGEYVKRYDNMTAAERSEYLNRVVDWLTIDGLCLTCKGEVFEARMQNVLQVSVGWNDQECAAFEEGAALMSALIGVADTRLPELLYAISAKRSIRHIFQTLREVVRGTDPDGGVKGEPGDDAYDVMRQSSGKAAGHTTYNIEAEGAISVTPNAKITTATVMGHSVQPVRPKHFDQYAHLLPQKTQERIAKYGPLMRELDELRERERLLMDAKDASAKDREAVAKRIAAIDKEIGDIRSEADREWDKLAQSGRVVVDDLGNARVVPSLQNDEAQEQEPAELTSEQKARRRELRKWLTDTRRGNGNTREEHVKKWTENFREYLALEGDKAFDDEKVREAIGHYGIDMEGLRTKED